MKNILIIISVAFFFGVNSYTQVTPQPSPKSTLTQEIGISEVKIVYSRPGVKGREIWGKLVPFNEIWRVGANANTTITLSDKAKINGNELDAGTYGIHAIPGKEEWTIIFSKDNTLWGSIGYKKDNDALRISVKPGISEFTERMTFDFQNITDEKADVVLRWEKLQVAFSVEFATQSLVMKKFDEAIKWQTPMNAANYSLRAGGDLSKAMKWIDISISIEENYWNLRTKAQLEAKNGNNKSAISLMEKAMDYASKMASAPFDKAEMEKLLSEWKK